MNAKVRKTGLKSIILMAIAAIVFLFGLFENLVLACYSDGLYPIISVTLRFISSLFPFAIGDIIYMILIVVAFYRLAFFIIKVKRRELSKAHRLLIPLQLLNIGLILFLVFKLFWGLNYSRPTIAQQLNIGNEKYEVKQLVKLGNYFINKLNLLQQEATPHLRYNTENLSVGAIKSYEQMAKKNPFFTYHQPSISQPSVAG